MELPVGRQDTRSIRKTPSNGLYYSCTIHVYVYMCKHVHIHISVYTVILLTSVYKLKFEGKGGSGGRPGLEGFVSSHIILHISMKKTSQKTPPEV